jgi:AcrR family transcriptional regulator
MNTRSLSNAADRAQLRAVPRGKPIPDVRARLIGAGERVLMGGGPGAISARAVAREAGVAPGVLYNHFADLDEFLVELVLERFRRQSRQAAELPALAGHGTVAGNLAAAARALLESPILAVAELVRARAGLFSRVAAAQQAGAPDMATIQHAIGRYLEAEKRLGRIAADADTEAAALMLVGAIHHLVLLHPADLPDPAIPAARVGEAVARAVAA